MTDDQARPLHRGDLGLPVYRDEVQNLEPPTIDLVAALVAREGVTVAETDAATVITIPRQYPPAAPLQEVGPRAADGGITIEAVAGGILVQCGTEDEVSLESSASWPDLLHYPATADLVAELRTRDGVGALDLEPAEDYEVSRSDPDCEFGTLDPVWSGAGPAILLKVVD